MAFKVHVGPPQIAIHQGQTVLVTEPDGQITWPSEKGLYFLDTRVVSNWAIYANGEPWELLNGGPISYYAARIFLTNKAILTEDGTIPPRTLGLTISRSISGGLHEDLDITNNSMKPVRFQLEIAFRCDFADVFEVKSGRIVRRGQITTEWSERAAAGSHRLFEPGLSSCGDHLGRARHRARRSPPMDGSVSKSRFNRARLGTPACSTRWRTASSISMRRAIAWAEPASRTIPRRWRNG